MAEEPDAVKLQLYATNKCSLSSILLKGEGDEAEQERIKPLRARLMNFIKKLNYLEAHASECLKLWLMPFVTSVREFPVVTAEHYKVIYSMLNNGAPDFRSGQYLDLADTLRPAVREYYVLAGLHNQPMDYIDNGAVYFANSMIQSLQNGARMHFEKQLRNFVLARLHVKAVRAKARKLMPDKEEYPLTPERDACVAFLGHFMHIFNRRARRLVRLITYDSWPYPEELGALRVNEYDVYSEAFDILPHSRILHGRDSLTNCLDRDFKDYVGPYLRLQCLCEAYDIKSPAAVPLKKIDRLKHVTIDTEMLKHVVGYQAGRGLHKQERRDAIWNELFDLNKKPFCTRVAKDLRFSGMMKTDGTSACVLLKHSSIMEKQYQTGSGIQDAAERQKAARLRYIHRPENVAKLRQHYKDQMEKKNTVILVFDPNKRNLLQGMELVPTLPNNKRRVFRFINELKAAYPGKQLVVVIGDWNDAGGTRKFQLSSKTTGFREILLAKARNVPWSLPEKGFRWCLASFQITYMAFHYVSGAATFWHA
ncbi:hypothetical protein HDU88_004648 [Geranomyces variabilis]|nr:hypothetical protein HDU88_004648 [Geranomyces variabilis]